MVPGTHAGVTGQSGMRGGQHCPDFKRILHCLGIWVIHILGAVVDGESRTDCVSG